MKKIVMIIIAILVVRGGYQIANGYSTEATIRAVIDGVNVICAYPADDVYVCEPENKEK